jgi:hypothetical protein
LRTSYNGRHPETGKPVVRIIHSSGRADHLVRLCQSIARFCGLQVIDPVSNTDDDKADSAPGLAKDLKLIRFTPGTVLVIEALWERPGINDI